MTDIYVLYKVKSTYSAEKKLYLKKIVINQEPETALWDKKIFYSAKN